MKAILRLLSIFALLGIVLFVAKLVYSTWHGDIEWNFRVNGQVLVNGKKTDGYMHANTAHTQLTLTRTDGPRPEAYIVWLQGKGSVTECGDWHPTRFVPYVIGDLLPPCDFVVDADNPQPPIHHNLAFGRNFVEFSTASGERVRGEW